MSRHVTREEWNGFLVRQEHAEFLQSWEWGENAYARDRTEILRVAFPEQGPLRAVIQFVERGEGTPFHYWYSPGGPVAFSTEDAEYVLDAAIAEIHGRGAPFIRIEPSSSLVGGERMKKVKDGRPATTRIIDLSDGREKVFSSMHEKTRYNIRLSTKKGLQVREVFSVNEDHPDFEQFTENMKSFHALLRETAQRGDFSLHPWLHYIHLIEAFCRSSETQPLSPEIPILRFYAAWYDGKMIAAILCMAFGDTVVYLHGASTSEHRSVMAPYALQWHAMLEAVSAGYRWYDLWGVAPDSSASDHPWAGITRFKQGFGGTVVEYPGTFDIPLRRIQYALYSAARIVNQHLRKPIQ